MSSGLVPERPASARRLPIGPQPEGRGRRQPGAPGAGPGAHGAHVGPAARWPRQGRARPERASAPAPGAAEQGLISAGSWRPVRSRAPRPNSMAIVRRSLCSGGGHFLRGWAGARRQETLRAGAAPAGSEATATCPGAPLALTKGVSVCWSAGGGWPECPLLGKDSGDWRTKSDLWSRRRVWGRRRSILS